MRLQDIMSTPVETVTPHTPVAEAHGLMKRQGIHHLVVMDGRKAVGVVSARDLTANRAGSVGDIMSAPVATARPRATVREAANLLRGRTVGCLPIVDGGKVVGIVTTSDLLELLGRGVERPIERSTSWTLRGRGPRKRRPTSDRQGLAYSR
jgi:CBS-domain-containing membrane protein